jgi:hypothetical protein
MKQSVSIYGRTVTLQKLGGERLYSVIDARTGALLASAPVRFLAIANAARELREKQPCPT